MPITMRVRVSTSIWAPCYHIDPAREPHLEPWHACNIAVSRADELLDPQYLKHLICDERAEAGYAGSSERHVLCIISACGSDGAAQHEFIWIELTVTVRLGDLVTHRVAL
jgi:hypothetical protein